MKISKISKTSKKKIIVLVSMIALLVVTGCLNFFLNAKLPTDGGKDPIVTPTFFASFRSEREVTRAEEIILLDSMITSEASSAEIKLSAEQKKLSLCTAMEQELNIESLIKAKGFEDCIVTISADNVNIVVKDADHTPEDAAQILSIVVAQTKYIADNVIITPYV